MSTNLGARIHQARKHAGLTTRELGACLGCSAMAVSKWEHGHMTPRPALMPALAEALGVKPGWFRHAITVTLTRPHWYRDASPD